MIEYIICFIFSIICTYAAEKKFKNKKKIEGIVFSIFAILIPSILAGVRSIDIGVDVKVYVYPFFINALNAENFFEFYTLLDIEPLYLFLTYIVSVFTTNVHWLLFFIQIIIFSLIYFYAYHNREKVPMWLCVMTYLLTFYNTTYNIARQSLAVAVILFSINFAREKKYLKTIVLYIIAIMFHTTAVFSILLYFLIFMENFNFKQKLKFIVYFITYSIFIGVMIYHQEILYFLSYTLNILPDKYYNYFNNSNYALRSIDINFFILAFRLLWLFLFFVQKNMKKAIHNKELFLIMLTDFILYMVSFKVTNAARMSYYYGTIGMIIGVPEILNIFKNKGSNRTFATIGIISILMMYWFMNYIVFGYDATYPYRFYR